MYTLYSLPGSCSTGIAILLENLGCDYKIARRDDVTDFKKISPTNSVPALVTPEGKTITEGAAIALFLLEKHAPQNLPSDPLEKAGFTKWLMFDYATLHPAYSKLFHALRGMNDGDEKIAYMQKLGDSVSGFYEILDTHLAENTYLFGTTPTIADYLIPIYASWGKNFPNVKITFGKNVERLMQEIRALPEFILAYEKEGIDYKMAA